MAPVAADDLKTDLVAKLKANRSLAVQDPFTNPFLLFALDLTHRLGSGEVTLDSVDHLVSSLTNDAFAARAERLGAYLGDCNPVVRREAITAMFERLADGGDFGAFAAAVATEPFGVVLTGHPTFALDYALSQILVELATGHDDAGRPLDDAAHAARLSAAAEMRHGAPADLTLDVEHFWSIQALESAAAAMDTIYACIFAVSRSRWPDRWTELRPRLLTLATWVGFDQDGRTDVTWQVSFEKRLDLKRVALARRRSALQALASDATGAWNAALQLILQTLTAAEATVRGQLEALSTSRQDVAAVAAFSRTLVEGRETALITREPLNVLLDAALPHAPSDAAREALMVIRAGIAANGLSAARIHVRLNSGQLHNAVRREAGLQTDPADPANRRTYFANIERLIDNARPVQTNLGDLLDEPASARRLMMTLAQMRKYIDASTPVRFLIAETETGFTLLTALYYARLFGVEESIEISPLFETEEAFDRGEKVVEEALRSPHFRAHLKHHGRLAIEFGFSDSGRFIGQMAATFRIERLRLRLAIMLEEQGLTDLEVIFFNTHGESIGRGGHPTSLSDRFRYAAPPRSRAEFAARGIAIKEEDAFQGGEGYLPLMTPVAALTTLGAALQSVFDDDPEAAGDPIYDDPDFASEYFATIQQGFSSLVADPDYAALVGLFGTHLLPKTGSRPTQRQSGDGRPTKMRSVSELRAIPNNGVLQQLGYFANTLFGVGSAAQKNLDTFKAMRARSPRFRRALDMAQGAWQGSDFSILFAYAATLEPATWLDRASQDLPGAADLVACGVAVRAEMSDNLTRVLRRLQAEDLALRCVLERVATERRERLLLLHALRIGLIQQICLLAVQFPDFNPRGDITRTTLQESLMRLDVAGALQHLQTIFALRSDGAEKADFGAPSGYDAAVGHAYLNEHEMVFEPLRRLYALVLAVSTAVTHEIGAVG